MEKNEVMEWINLCAGLMMVALWFFVMLSATAMTFAVYGVNTATVITTLCFWLALGVIFVLAVVEPCARMRKRRKKIEEVVV